jgi:hypothetical protein
MNPPIYRIIQAYIVSLSNNSYSFNKLILYIQLKFKVCTYYTDIFLTIQ